MKNLIMALMVLTTLVSCGKSNSVGSSSVFGTSPITVGGASETTLGSMIDNNQFGSGMANYYETWSQVVFRMPGISYKYGNVSNTANCRVVGGIFRICTYSSGTSVPVTRTVVNSAVDLAAKKNELKALINNRSYIQAYGTAFYIRTTDGKTHVIDTRYPLQANPVSVQQTDGTQEIFLRAE